MTKKMLSIKQLIFLKWMVLIIGAVTFGVSNTHLHPCKENARPDMNDFLCLLINITSEKERQTLNMF
jgi:hypothetical protein